MKTAAVSELKAKLAQYLRMVKAGESIEIHERGVPVATLSGVKTTTPLETTPPRRDPGKLASMRFSVKLPQKVDVVDFLVSDRRKR